MRGVPGNGEHGAVPCPNNPALPQIITLVDRHGPTYTWCTPPVSGPGAGSAFCERGKWEQHERNGREGEQRQREREREGVRGEYGMGLSPWLGSGIAPRMDQCFRETYTVYEM